MFALALALGAGGLLAAGAAIATAIGSVHAGTGGSHGLMAAGLRFTYPAVNGAGAVLLVIATLGTVTVAIAACACWRQRRRYRELIAQMPMVKLLERDERVKVIADGRPQAFCAGYLRPTVYVSQQTVELLSDPELGAVLAHEHHHRRVRDPLRFACVGILSDALFFVPVLKRLSERYADLAELSADRAAVQASGGEGAPLASALLTFDESGPPGVTGISPERVDSLLGQPTRWRLPLGRLVASIGSLTALGLVIWTASGAASAHASLNPPILSSQPCVMMTSILPFVGCLRMVASRLKRKRSSAR